jgi:hypothetical protein
LSSERGDSHCIWFDGRSSEIVTPLSLTGGQSGGTGIRVWFPAGRTGWSVALAHRLQVRGVQPGADHFKPVQPDEPMVRSPSESTWAGRMVFHTGPLASSDPHQRDSPVRHPDGSPSPRSPRTTNHSRRPGPCGVRDGYRASRGRPASGSVGHIMPPWQHGVAGLPALLTRLPK